MSSKGSNLAAHVKDLGAAITANVAYKKGRILAHRGLWSSKFDENSEGAITSAVESGFGVELDIRSCDGNLVLAHDAADERTGPLAVKVLDMLHSLDGVWIGVNVKNDGLQEMAPVITGQHFFFDMSIPEHLNYQRAKRPVAVRASEFESLNNAFVCDPATVAIWVDGFYSDWYLQDESRLDNLLQQKLPKFFVSPELHGRPNNLAWQTIAELMKTREDVGICTDYPEDFFELIR